MIELVKNSSDEAIALGLKGRGVVETPFEDAAKEMDIENARPKKQWFMDLYEVADSLALPYPECGVDSKPSSDQVVDEEA